MTALSLMAALVTLAIVKRPRTVPLSQCSELYQRYHKVEGVEASYIQGFALNDSTTVDITVLKATDSTGWDLLKADFNIHELLPIVVDEINQGGRSVTLKLFPKDCPGQSTDTIFTNNDAVVICRDQLLICVFHLVSEKQYDDIVNHNIKDITINNKPL